MYIILDKNTGEVLYGSAVLLEDMRENEIIIPLPTDYQITENSIYNFETKSFYEKSE